MFSYLSEYAYAPHVKELSMRNFVRRAFNEQFHSYLHLLAQALLSLLGHAIIVQYRRIYDHCIRPLTFSCVQSLLLLAYHFLKSKKSVLCSFHYMNEYDCAICKVFE